MAEKPNFKGILKINETSEEIQVSVSMVIHNNSDNSSTWDGHFYTSEHIESSPEGLLAIEGVGERQIQGVKSEFSGYMFKSST